jgi:hypothetical protein
MSIKGGPQVLGLAHGRGTGGNQVSLNAELQHTVRGNSMRRIVEHSEACDTGEEDVVADGEVTPMTALSSGSQARGLTLGRTPLRSASPQV